MAANRSLKWKCLSSLLAALALAACAVPGPAPPAPPSPAQGLAGVSDAGQLRDHEGLLAILWVQTAAEYEANARLVYRAATDRLDEAIADPDWDALAHEAEPGAPGRPPAVILDVDETVLDNSAYQARLVQDGGVYETDSWYAWCEERQARAVPGALAFTRLADARGVRVIYLTNRDHVLEAATADNLRALGFPVPADEDVVLTRGEREDWTSAKTARRAWVAERYRVIMLFGDNLGDFLSPYRVPIEERSALVERYGERWGRDWFMLPNPLYGSWESALFWHDYGRSLDERRAARYEALRTER
ncbi:MAG: 5'-nucleotidase, lipoprotein e(P4) family [Gammaproteobacteria bacterium]